MHNLMNVGLFYEFGAKANLFLPSLIILTKSPVDSKAGEQKPLTKGNHLPRPASLY